MARTLPLTPIRWPLFRIMVKQSWGGQTTSGGGWWPLEMRRRDLRTGHGYYLIDLERQSLPAVGRARFAFDFGRFAGGAVGLSSTSNARVRAGQTWDASTDSLDLLDLTNYEIRIQAAPLPEHPESGTPAWRTVWWGQCDYIEDTGSPAALIPMGTRTYHCTDALFRAHRWVMNRHGVLATDDSNNSRSFDNCVGHPGFNVSQGGRSARVAFNRSGSQYQVNAGGGVEDPAAFADSHTLPGAATSGWTDKQAIDHSLIATRPAGQPLFILTGSTGLFASVHAWEVQDDQTVHEFLIKLCRRQRGRGCVFVDWDDDSGAPDGPLTARLYCRPMLLDDITFGKFSNAAIVTLPGATTEGATFAVDLIGDHRLVDDDFKISERINAEYDYLETTGEKIQVVATLSYLDAPVLGDGCSLARRWSSADQAAFRAITPATERLDEVWNHVYQLHGLPRSWDGTCGDGNGGLRLRVDYRCSDIGQIWSPAIDVQPDTNPSLVRVLSDMPLYQGYTCTGTTYVRKDGATEKGNPQRRQMQLFLRQEPNLYFTDQNDQGRKLNNQRVTLTPRMDDDGIIIADGSDAETGARAIGSRTGSTSPDSLNSAYDYTALVLTVGLEMPHRVRLASGLATGQRRLTITHPNMHLWVIAYNAIYDLDSANGDLTDGFPAQRHALNGSTTSPGTLRDDRDGLQELHELASAYYLNVRRPCSWAIRDFGLFATYNAYAGTNPDFSTSPTAFSYPSLGKFITTITANGQIHTVNCPVTGVTYDNTSGTTRWECDWSSLDMA